MTDIDPDSSDSSQDAFPSDLPSPSRTWLEAFKRQLLREGEIPTEEPAARSHITFHPHIQTFEDVRTAALGLRSGIPQIISLADAPDETAQRLLDFLQGVVYVINGHQTCISPSIFLFTPNTVDIVQSDVQSD